MSDLLLNLGSNPRTRRLVKQLGLPIPLPQPLKREPGPMTARPLEGKAIFVSAAPSSSALPSVALTLAQAGASPWLASAELLPGFHDASEAFGRPGKVLEPQDDSVRLEGLLLDAGELSDLTSLQALFATLQPLLPRLSPCAKIVLLDRRLDHARPLWEATHAALDGLVRSLAKELGRSGITVNRVLLEGQAEERLGPVLSFLLSARSGFITGQTLAVSARLRAVPHPPLTRPLDGKIAAVTGAARGIGEAIARRLALEGARVVLVDRPEDDKAVSQLARELGGVSVLTDVTAPDAGARLHDALQALGGLDVLVHNAGITRDRTLARMKPEQWESVLDVNLGAIARLTEATEPLLREQGRLLCLSSIAGIAGNVGQTAYAASKAGVIGFVRAQAIRLAPRGISVNAIAPGFIETRMTAAVPLAIREVARRLSALSQGGQPDDVAQAITFLATPGAQGITGQTLRVCGGAFIGA